MRRDRRIPRALAPLLVVLLALLGAACGSGSSDSGGGGTGAAGTDGKAAQAMPATSLGFVDANIDRSSDAWKKLESLGSRFPGWADFTAQITKQLDSGSGGTNDVSFTKDIEPWLGGEAGGAVVSVSPAASSSGGTGSSSPQPTFVAYVESKDDAKLEAALVKSGNTTKTGERSGYTLYTGKDDIYAAVGKDALLISNDQAALGRSIDVREGNGDKLSDLDRFKEAMGELPADNLVVGYLDGQGLSQLANVAMAQAKASGSSLPTEQLGQLGQLQDQLGAFRAAAFSFGAEDNGFRVKAVSLLDSAKAEKAGLDQGTFEPQLLKNVPASAFAYVGFQNLGKVLERILDQASTTPGVGDQVKAFETQLGLSVKDDIVPLLSGEHALYAGTGAPFSAALLIKPSDAAKGAATLKKLTAAVSKLVPGTTFTPLPSGEGESTAVGGLPVQWHRAGDVIAISNDANAGEVPSSSLADSDAFKRVRDQAGQSGEVTALVYVDVPGILGLAESLGQSAGSQVDENAKHVGGFLAWGTASKEKATFEAYLEVKK